MICWKEFKIIIVSSLIEKKPLLNNMRRVLSNSMRKSSIIAGILFAIGLTYLVPFFIYGGIEFRDLFGILFIIGAIIVYQKYKPKKNSSEATPDKTIYEPNESDNTSLEILKIRYAKGEITREEYEEKKKELE
jgi:uncharacterized membrane protein